MEQGILVASFGTSHEETRRKTICAVERSIREAYPGHLVEEAYTSGMVRSILASRGIPVPSPEQALERLLGRGVQRLAVQPTHLIPGEEYDKLLRVLRRYAPRFAGIRVGRPLFGATEDLRAAAALLSARFPRRDDACVVLMGHGSSHPANMAYPALAWLLQAQGRPDMLVATVEGDPALSDLLPSLRKQAVGRVTLAPLMLVAGDHAVHDMAGDGPESWKSVLTSQGFSVRVELRGLGEDPGFQALYLRHLAQAAALE